LALKDIQVKALKPKKKQYKAYDSGGLFLIVTPKGGKWWRLKYRFDGKEKTLSLGTYPLISLKEARIKRDEAKKLLLEGVDPSDNKKAKKAAREESSANSFEVVAREWITKTGNSESHNHRVLRRLEKDIFPWLGGKPIEEVTPPDLLKAARRIEDRGTIETAHRVLASCGQVFRYAIATGRATSDPSRDLRGALLPVQKQHLAAIIEPKEVAKLLQMIDDYEGSLIVRCALKLAPLVFVRPGELRQAKWEDFNFETKEWRFLASKTHTPHIVPLCKQAIEVLEEIKPLTEIGEYVFPSERTRTRPMSNNTLNAAMRRMGIKKDEMTAHGFRAMARTLLDEVLKFPADIIEHQLAHTVRGPLGRAYNRTTHLEARKEMMQVWADYLDKLKYK
jgi:integrase